MKVAFLLGTLKRGGTETLVLDIFNYHQKISFEIIGIYKKKEALYNAFTLSEVPFFKINPGKLSMHWLYLFRLRNLIKNENVTIIHSNQRIDTLYSRIACLGLSVKIVQTFHDFDFTYSKLNKLILNVSLLAADRNIFVSEYQKKHYLTSYKSLTKKIQYHIYNGIDFSKFNVTQHISIRKENNINDNRILLGMVGNFNNGRDHLTVCRFLVLLKKESVNYTFLFIGGKDKKNPEHFYQCRSFCDKNQISENVIFLGSRPDAQLIMPQLDAFIYSSDHDTFGLAVIEAIAAGIPVFVNDWPVMKEITENGQRAIVFKSKDERNLLEKFMLFHNQPGPYLDKAKENAEWAKKEFSIQKHINKLHKMYTTL